jgi:hypothetical protein
MVRQIWQESCDKLSPIGHGADEAALRDREKAVTLRIPGKTKTGQTQEINLADAKIGP